LQRYVVAWTSLPEVIYFCRGGKPVAVVLIDAKGLNVPADDPDDDQGDEDGKGRQLEVVPTA
jgi:hypothetical protein